MGRLAAVAAFVALTSAVAASSRQDPVMTARGNQVMGFDQDKTTHHFLLYEDGGAIDISVKDPADTVNRDAIRAHLPHVAMMFGGGSFSMPHEVHDIDVPGTATMARLKGAIAYEYRETPLGGRVDIVTTQPDALSAVHEFLKFQIADHKTGDSLDVRRRGRDFFPQIRPAGGQRPVTRPASVPGSAESVEKSPVPYRLAQTSISPRPRLAHAK